MIPMPTVAVMPAVSLVTPVATVVMCAVVMVVIAVIMAAVVFATDNVVPVVMVSARRVGLDTVVAMRTHTPHYIPPMGILPLSIQADLTQP